MTDHTRHRLAAVATIATAALLGLGAPVAAAPGASDDGAPVPDFDNTPLCFVPFPNPGVACFADGSATGGSQIVSWVWEYPGLVSNKATGQFTGLLFARTGDFDVTLTVTDDQNRTGSVTETMDVVIGRWPIDGGGPSHPSGVSVPAGG